VEGTLHGVFLARELIRFADMASAPSSRPIPLPSPKVQAFVAEHYEESGAAGLGIDVPALAAIVTDVLVQRGDADVDAALASLHLNEVVLARACLAGNEKAWDLFMSRYRGAMYEAAYKIAHDEAAGRSLADSLYAELYGLSDSGEVRASRLRYYLGRGSLAGWLRTVLAQEYVNRYRRTKRETSLEAAIEDGRQFPAHESEQSTLDPRVATATECELTALEAEERFLLSAYFLDGRRLADIANLLDVHESTISRKLDRVTTALRKRIRKRLVAAGMSPRQADEALEELDVRDLQVNVGETFRQGEGKFSFYRKSREEG